MVSQRSSQSLQMFSVKYIVPFWSTSIKAKPKGVQPIWLMRYINTGQRSIIHSHPKKLANNVEAILVYELTWSVGSEYFLGTWSGHNKHCAGEETTWKFLQMLLQYAFESESNIAIASSQVWKHCRNVSISMWRPRHVMSALAHLLYNGFRSCKETALLVVTFKSQG